MNEVRLNNRSIISLYKFTTCHEKRHSISSNMLDEHCQTQNSCRSQHREKNERMEYRRIDERNDEEEMWKVWRQQLWRSMSIFCEGLFVDRPISRKHHTSHFNEKYSPESIPRFLHFDIFCIAWKNIGQINYASPLHFNHFSEICFHFYIQDIQNGVVKYLYIKNF